MFRSLTDFCKKYVPLCLCSILLASLLALDAQLADTPAGEKGLEDRLKKDLSSLASDSMLGREAGTDGEKKACEYICGRFTEIGLKSALKDGTFVQCFELEDSDGSSKRTARNVIGCVNNHSETTVVIGAHYDHIGMGGKPSRSPGKHEVHNGADDNASGVAALLELADYSVRAKDRKCNYLFVAFSGHEQGMRGSQYFVNGGVVESAKLNYMINLDMIGRLDPGTKRVLVGGTGSCAVFAQVTSEPGHDGFEIVHRDLPKGDQSSFADMKVPFLYFTTGMHDDYHKVSDDTEKISFSGMARLVEYLEALLESLDGKDKLVFSDSQ